MSAPQPKKEGGEPQNPQSTLRATSAATTKTKTGVIKWSQMVVEGINCLGEAILAAQAQVHSSVKNQMKAEKVASEKILEGRAKVIRGLCMPNSKINEQIKAVSNSKKIRVLEGDEFQTKYQTNSVEYGGAVISVTKNSRATPMNQAQVMPDVCAVPASQAAGVTGQLAWSPCAVGDTVMHMAVKVRDPVIIAVVLCMGCQVNARNGDGDSAEELARFYGVPLKRLPSGVKKTLWAYEVLQSLRILSACTEQDEVVRLDISLEIIVSLCREDVDPAGLIFELGDNKGKSVYHRWEGLGRERGLDSDDFQTDPYVNRVLSISKSSQSKGIAGDVIARKIAKDSEGGKSPIRPKDKEKVKMDPSEEPEDLLRLRALLPDAGTQLASIRVKFGGAKAVIFKNEHLHIADGDTFLIIAVRAYLPHLIRFLLAFGCDPKQQNFAGKSAESTATSLGLNLSHMVPSKKKAEFFQRQHPLMACLLACLTLKPPRRNEKGIVARMMNTHERKLPVDKYRFVAKTNQ